MKSAGAVRLADADVPRVASLDGLRGIAVALVLVGHLWPSVMTGGFVGVSVFFTMSGYLITSLALERAPTAARGEWLRRFWTARIARLAPLGIAVLLVTALLTRLWPQTSGSRYEFLAALTHVLNLYYFFGQTSYADAFADPSAIQHYWSLSIEEQFYLFFPVVIVVCIALARRQKVPVATLVRVPAWLCLAWSIVLSIVATPGRDYFRSDLRMGEIAAGVLLATFVPLGRLAETATTPSTRDPLWWTPLGGILGLSLAVNAAQHATYFPGFACVSAATAFTILGLRASPSLRTALEFRPLTWLGKVSYGVYLIHWPALVFANRALPHAPSEVIGFLVLAVTLPLAALSFRWFETPTRRAGRSGRPFLAYGAAALIAAVMLLGLPRKDLGPTLRSTDSVEVAESDDRQVTLILGDSVGSNVFSEVDEQPTRRFAQYIVLGCPFVDGDQLDSRQPDKVLYADSRTCREWRSKTAPLMASTRLDSIVVLTGYSLPQTILSTGHGACTAEFQEYYRTQLRETMSYLATKAPVLWIMSHRTWVPDGLTASMPNQRENMMCLRQVQAEVAQDTKGVTLVDFDDFVCPDGPETCTTEVAAQRLVDGVHVRPEAAAEARQWVYDEVAPLVD